MRDRYSSNNEKAMNMHCSSCGNSLEGASKFCSNCGTPAVDSPAPVSLQPTYSFVVTGEIVDGQTLDAVKNNLEKFIKLDRKTLDGIFTKRNVVLKKSIDKETAEKYKKAFAKCGAICDIAENVTNTLTNDKSTDSISQPHQGRQADQDGGVAILNRGDDDFYGLEGVQTKGDVENSTKESVKRNRVEKSPSVGRKIWLGFCYSFGLLLAVGFIGSQFDDEASSSTSSSENQTISNSTSEPLEWIDGNGNIRYGHSVDITTQTILNEADLFKSTGIPVCLTYAGMLESIAYSGVPASVKIMKSDHVLEQGHKYGCY